MRYFTFRKDALRHRLAGQVLRFTKGKGYWLFGRIYAAVLMFDSVTVAAIPKNAKAVAGYVGGRWPTFSYLGKCFPSAWKISIAVSASEDAECLDVENGDATNAQAPSWYKRQLARGVVRPRLYTSVSNVEPLREVMKGAGFDVPYDDIWSAHYTLKPHRCGPACGFGMRGVVGATQFHNNFRGRNLDASLCSPTFFSIGGSV